MTVNRPRYSKIERLVSDLLAEYGVSSPPVPIEDIIKKHGVEIRVGKLDDISGFIVRENQKVLIGVNRTHPPTRRRFTLAHEFGHFLLHPGRSTWYDKDYRVNLRSELSSKAEDVEEIEANFFAACILMPIGFLRNDKTVRLVDIEDGDAVKGLAKKYGVSTQAMNLRLLNVTGRL